MAGPPAYRDRLPSPRHVLVIGEGVPPTATRSFAADLAASDDRFTVAPTDPEEIALLHFTELEMGFSALRRSCREIVERRRARAPRSRGRGA